MAKIVFHKLIKKERLIYGSLFAPAHLLALPLGVVLLVVLRVSLLVLTVVSLLGAGLALLALLTPVALVLPLWLMWVIMVIPLLLIRCTMWILSLQWSRMPTLVVRTSTRTLPRSTRTRLLALLMTPTFVMPLPEQPWTFKLLCPATWQLLTWSWWFPFLLSTASMPVFGW